MFYAAALVPYVSVGKPITKVTYKHTPRKHLCLLELTIECALYCRQSEEAFIKQERSISPKQTLPVPGKPEAGVSGNFVTNLPKWQLSRNLVTCKHFVCLLGYNCRMKPQAISILLG